MPPYGVIYHHLPWETVFRGNLTVGMESPGLTASLAIGEEICGRLEG
jgi:hypothetical protein